MKIARYFFIGTIAVVCVLLSPQVSHAAPPAGFTSEKYVSMPFLATDLEFSPDGRLFALDKEGSVRVMKNGTLVTTPFLTLKVASDDERGLLGIAFDPSFPTNRYLYLYYTTGSGSKNYGGSPKNRLSRFTASATNPDVVQAGSEKILLDNIASDTGEHNGGCLRIGPDNKLYIATGDGGETHTNSQNLAKLNGKILRLNLDGSIPSDNPFVGQRGKRGEIWLYGLRNPWRFAFSPKDGTMFIADVGEGTSEEVDVGVKGKNYGWPQTEGPHPGGVDGVTYPVYSYEHGGTGASIIGGEVYNGTNFPASYKGKYFFTDFVKFFIRTLSYNPTTQTVSVETFDPDAGGTVDLAFGADGAMYLDVADSPVSSHVQKISYAGGALSNRPTADIFSSTPYGPLPFAVNFSAAGSKDPVGKGLSYDWDFGDGLRAKGRVVGHSFVRKGTYRVLLTLKDGNGTLAQASTRVLAGSTAPMVTLVLPKPRSVYRAGDAVTYSAIANDREDGPLKVSSFRWVISFHHEDHVHPFLGPLTNTKSGTFTIPSDGVASPMVWYEVALTVTDSDGLSTTVRRNVTPITIPVTITSNITNPGILLDGQPMVTPKNFLLVSRFPRVVEAPATAMIGGVSYTFVRWSDNGPRRRTIRSSSTPVSIRAIYELAVSKSL